jgi:hypothetical protein
MTKADATIGTVELFKIERYEEYAVKGIRVYEMHGDEGLAFGVFASDGSRIVVVDTLGEALKRADWESYHTQLSDVY